MIEAVFICFLQCGLVLFLSLSFLPSVNGDVIADSCNWFETFRGVTIKEKKKMLYPSKHLHHNWVCLQTDDEWRTILKLFFLFFQVVWTSELNLKVTMPRRPAGRRQLSSDDDSDSSSSTSSSEDEMTRKPRRRVTAGTRAPAGKPSQSKDSKILSKVSWSHKRYKRWLLNWDHCLKKIENPNFLHPYSMDSLFF